MEYQKYPEKLYDIEDEALQEMWKSVFDFNAAVARLAWDDETFSDEAKCDVFEEPQCNMEYDEEYDAYVTIEVPIANVPESFFGDTNE